MISQQNETTVIPAHAGISVIKPAKSLGNFTYRLNDVKFLEQSFKVNPYLNDKYFFETKILSDQVNHYSIQNFIFKYYI